VKLLIVTQKVDQNDPILGFFHSWIRTFADHCDHVEVLGQLVGESDFPSNVSVHSLGKEKRSPKVIQVLRFWKSIFSLRRNYDTVLVHMTPVWACIGWPLWFILRKRVFLWYEARGGKLWLPLSLLFVKKVFSATPRGLPRETGKSIIVGHGIDTDVFSPSGERESGLLVTAGRITRIKYLEAILACLQELSSPYHLLIAGGTITKEDETYLKEVRMKIEEMGLSSRVTIEWRDPLKMPSLFQRAECYLHAAGGGLDKVILEAMASGTLVLSSSEATKDILPSQCQSQRVDMPGKLKDLLELPEEEKERLRKELRTLVERDHTLTNFIERLVQEMGS